MKKIFISYSDKDKNKMRTLEKLIGKSSVLRPNIIADNRQTSKLLSDKVKKGISECDYFIPILTRSSLTAQWLNQEIGYATALNKMQWPIVEKSVTNKLRGFIHKQMDLSYTFEGNARNKRSEAVKFTSVARILVNDLLFENREVPKKFTIEDLFPGKWESSFFIGQKEHKEKEIEVNNKNKYFVNGGHKFNLKEIRLDLKNNKLKFIKSGVGGDNSKILNDLKIIELGKRYEGFEDSSTYGEDIRITYTRLL